MLYLVPANDDKSREDLELLSFTVDRPVRIHLMYNNSQSDLPSAFSGWQDTGAVVKNTDINLRIWTKEFAAGSITLPANRAGGGGGSAYTLAVEGLDQPAGQRSVRLLNVTDFLWQHIDGTSGQQSAGESVFDGLSNTADQTFEPILPAPTGGG